MTELVRSRKRIVADLGQGDQRWALVGGLAVSAHVEPRMTRDVDVAIAVSVDSEAESQDAQSIVVDAVVRVWDDPSAGAGPWVFRLSLDGVEKSSMFVEPRREIGELVLGAYDLSTGLDGRVYLGGAVSVVDEPRALDLEL